MNKASLLALTLLILSLLLAAGSGCSSQGAGSSPDAGPDAISPPEGEASGDFSSFACEDCHLSPDLPDLNPLLTGGSGANGKHVLHYSTRGFACEKCHLDYLSAITHINSTLDAPDPAVQIVFFDTTNPSGIWSNDLAPQTGQCSSLACHGPDTLDWYGTGSWSLPVCSVCHTAVVGTRRAVMGTGGDFGANSSNQSHHVTGGADPSDVQCQVCHDLSQHMSGAVRLIEADTSAVFVYNSTDPSSAEGFCLSCHDSNGAGGVTEPFADGSTLGVEPYRMSADINDYWNRAYGHGNEGLTCLGSGEPATGCHANGHGTSFVGILARNLELPNYGGANFGYEPSDEPLYDLCFHCHASYPGITKEYILGVQAGSNYDWDHYWSWYGGPSTPPYYIPNISTTFRDRNSQRTGRSYDDVSWWGDFFNLHFWHLDDFSWNYRNTYASGITCISCHNVHGSNTQFGWIYDELGWAHDTGVGSEEYATMANPANTMSYPVSCTSDCHLPSVGGLTHMWFSPPNE